MNSNSLAAIFTDIDFILQKVIDIEQLAFQLWQSCKLIERQMLIDDTHT